MSEARTKQWMVFLVAVVTLALGPPPVAARVPCEFDTGGDGVPELLVPDTDGDGACDFPDHKTHLPGTLRFRADAPVELHGQPVIEADEIIIEPGASVTAAPGAVRSLTMMSMRGGLAVLGELSVVAADDIQLVARLGSVDLAGLVRLLAGDRLSVDAHLGWVTVEAVLPSSDFTLFAGNRVDLRARTTIGSILVAGAVIGGRTVSLDARANLSVIGDKAVLLQDGAILTTDPARTGLAVGGDIRIDASGLVQVSATTQLDSGRNLHVSTRARTNDVCLGDGTLLQARGEDGNPRRIDLRRVRGALGDGGSVTFDGLLLAGPRGRCDACPDALEPAPEPAVPAVAAAATPKEAFIEEHNTTRKNADNPKPTKALAAVDWNDKLETSAQYWATKIAPDCQCDESKIHSKHPALAALKTATVEITVPESFANKKADYIALGRNQLKNDQTKPVLQSGTGELLDESGNPNPGGGGTPTVDVKLDGVFKPVGFVRVGENVAILPRQDATSAARAAVKAWAAEKPNFSYDNKDGTSSRCIKKNGATLKCGHYTQIVWAESTMIGCGIQECADGKNVAVVCQYLAVGNVKPPNQSVVRVPYEK